MNKSTYGNGTTYLRGKIWWIKYSVDGVQHFESSKSEKQSDALLMLRQKLVRHRDLGVVVTSTKATIGHLLKLVIQSYEDREAGREREPGEKKWNSLEWARMVVKKRLGPFLGHRKAEALTTTVIRAYIDKRRKEGMKNSTINRELTLLRRGYNLGRQHQPRLVGEVPLIPTLEENNIRKGFFGTEDFLEVQKHLHEDIIPVTDLAFLTGMRKEEVLRLKWVQVDFFNRVVRLEPGTTKNREGRNLPMSDHICEMLKDLYKTIDPRWKDAQYVFVWRHKFGHGARIGSRIKRFDRSWKKACEAAGVDGRMFHDFRRTAARNLIASGANEKVVMEIGGWKTRNVFERYNISNDALTRDAINRVEKLHRRPVEIRKVGGGADERT